MEETPKLYTMKQVAHLCSCSVATVSRWMKCGVLPTVRIGGRVYVEHESLMACIRANTRKSDVL